MKTNENIVYQINIRNNTIKKWYVVGVDKINDIWYVIVVDKPQNKYEFTKEKLAFGSFGKYVFTNKTEAEISLEEFNSYREYTITFSCSHKDTVRLRGPRSQDDKKIEKISKGKCKKCRNKESEEKGLMPVEVPYHIYKKKYSHCDTKVDSLREVNGEKRIVVYLEQPSP